MYFMPAVSLNEVYNQPWKSDLSLIKSGKALTNVLFSIDTLHFRIKADATI